MALRGGVYEWDYKGFIAFLTTVEDPTTRAWLLDIEAELLQLGFDVQQEEATRLAPEGASQNAGHAAPLQRGKEHDSPEARREPLDRKSKETQDTWKVRFAARQAERATS